MARASSRSLSPCIDISDSSDGEDDGPSLPLTNPMLLLRPGAMRSAPTARPLPGAATRMPLDYTSGVDHAIAGGVLDDSCSDVSWDDAGSDSDGESSSVHGNASSIFRLVALPAQAPSRESIHRPSGSLRLGNRSTAAVPGACATVYRTLPSSAEDIASGSDRGTSSAGTDNAAVSQPQGDAAGIELNVLQDAVASSSSAAGDRTCLNVSACAVPGTNDEETQPMNAIDAVGERMSGANDEETQPMCTNDAAGERKSKEALESLQLQLSVLERSNGELQERVRRQAQVEHEVLVCPICTCQLAHPCAEGGGDDDKALVVTSCGHIYHKNCLER